MPSFQDDIMREFDQGVHDIESEKALKKPIPPLAEGQESLADIFDAGVKEIERAGVKETPLLPAAGRIPSPDLKPKGSTLGAFARTVGRVPENLAAKTIMAVQGQKGASVADKDIADRFVSWVERRNRSLAESYEKTGDFIPGLISKKDVAELGPNLAFSGVSMAGTIGGAAVTAPIPVPGARIAGAMAGGATAAYRMDSYQAMDGWLKKRNEENIKLFGRPISIEEENKFKKEFNKLATEHGLWEAGPEAVGNVLDLALMTAKNLPGMRFVPEKLMGKAVKGALRVGGILATEEITETVTQMGQQRIEAEVEGGTKRQWQSGEDWLKSAKEVLPQVIMLTGVMGAGGAAYRKATQKEGDSTGKLKQQILDSITEVYERGEQTADQVVISITEGYGSGLFDDVDLEELSKKFPDLKDKIEVGKMTAKTKLVNEQLTAAIDEGITTGKLQGEEFTTDDAINFINNGTANDIFTTEDIESFKEKYPELRGELNNLIAEKVTTDIDIDIDLEFEPIAEPVTEEPKYATQDIENIYLKAKERVRKEPLTIHELQERFRERHDRKATAREQENIKRLYERAKKRAQKGKIVEEKKEPVVSKTQEELDLEAYKPSLPPGQKEVRVKEGERTYPRGAVFVAGKPAPEELKVEYKAVLKKVGKKESPWLTLSGARNAIESDKMKAMNISPATHKVVATKGGYQIVPIKAGGPALAREVKKEVKGKTLLSWVRAMGGVKDLTLPGEIRALAAKETGIVGLTTLAPAKGLPFDEMAQAAVENGWLPENLEDPAGTFAELLRNDIFAQKEKGPRAERLADVAERTEREERWKEFDRAEDDMLKYFAEHPNEEFLTDLDQWQKESIADIRIHDAKRAKEIEEDTRREVEEENTDLEGLKEDEGFSEFIEAWDEKEILDEETTAELEAWRAEQKDELEVPEAVSHIELVKRYVKETGKKVEEGELHKVKERYSKEWARIEEANAYKKELWDKLPESFRRNRGINEYTTKELEGMAKEVKPEVREPEAPKLIETKYRKRLEELKAEALLSSKKKAGVNYEMEVMVAETGETVTVTKDAAVALRETKEELNKYEKFLECII